MPKIDTKDLFKQAEDLNEQLETIYERRVANRQLLRLLRDSDQLSEAEEEQLEAIYPPRERRESEEDSGEALE